jgi:hypothetical protein
MSVTHKERLGATHSLHSGPMAPKCWKVVPGVQMTLKIKGGGLEAAQLGPGAVKAIADLVERSLNQAARCVVFGVLACLLAWHHSVTHLRSMLSRSGHRKPGKACGPTQSPLWSRPLPFEPFPPWAERVQSAHLV